jgi:hypothetical protein
VKELEAQLATQTSSRVQIASSMLETLGAEDESTVDSIATNAFNETPQKDIGFFGIHAIRWSERYIATD